MTHSTTKRSQWLAMLAKLTSPLEATAAAQAFLAYIPLLEQFPNEAFTTASLEHVASQCRHGVPTYADMRAHLGEWWKDNRPRPTAIPAPLPEGRAEPTEAEKQAVRAAVVSAVAAMQAAHDRQEAGRLPAERPAARHLTRTQLNAAYAADGLQGPKVTP